MQDVVQGLLILSPILVLITFLLAGVLTWRFPPIFYAMMFYILGLAGNRVLKVISGVLVSEDTSFRPTNCPLPNARGECERCHAFPKWGAPLHDDEMLGMPSGHAQAMVMLATAWSLYACRYVTCIQHQIFSIVLLWSWAIAVCIQRVHSRCHTVKQVLVGSLVGIAAGVLTHMVAGAHSMIV